ncbi:MAG TPA: hypothetical protein VKC90_04995 [Chitinophagaceae bacterium]|nr:hypothetical protein [Chitinophagaceae bacterium]
MEQLHHLTHSSLVDMLAEYTLRYTKLHREGGSEEDINFCLQTIESLTSEIALRKEKAIRDNTNINTTQFTLSGEQIVQGTVE